MTWDGLGSTWRISMICILFYIAWSHLNKCNSVDLLPVVSLSLSLLSQLGFSVLAVIALWKVFQWVLKPSVFKFVSFFLHMLVCAFVMLSATSTCSINCPKDLYVHYYGVCLYFGMSSCVHISKSWFLFRRVGYPWNMFIVSIWKLEKLLHYGFRNLWIFRL